MTLENLTKEAKQLELQIGHDKRIFRQYFARRRAKAEAAEAVVMKLSEREITKQIREYLAIQHVFHWKNWQGLGSAPGVADILGIYKGKPLAIEVKTEKGKLSTNQALFLEQFRAEGGIAIIARSVSDIADIIR